MLPIRLFFKFAELSLVVRSTIHIAIHGGSYDSVSVFVVDPVCAHPKMRVVGERVHA